jgi:hypothetical protein
MRFAVLKLSFRVDLDPQNLASTSIMANFKLQSMLKLKFEGEDEL